jgi:predicted O-methyltransferase YrrM
VDGACWMDERMFELGGTKFVAAGLLAVSPREECFVVDKRPELVRKYFRLLADECPRRIVELGVERGGSTALVALLAEPDLLLAVDVAPEIPAQLTEFIESKGLTRSIVPAFGIDQSNTTAVRDLVELHIGAEPVDLIIDDASHVLGSTRASFEVLFPRLRPGGLYVIEDWAADCDVAAGLYEALPTWASFDDRFETVRAICLQVMDKPLERGVPAEVLERITDQMRRTSNETNGIAARSFIASLASAVHREENFSVLAPLVRDRGPSRPLADLAIELTMICTSRPDVVSEVRLEPDWLTARRGDGAVSPDDFRLSDSWADYFGYLR